MTNPRFPRRTRSATSNATRNRRIRRTFTNPIAADCNLELAVIAGRVGDAA